MAEIIEMFAKIGFIFGVNMGVLNPILTWIERKQAGLMQDRVGANRADILGFTALGLFHAMADGIKLITKEDFTPDGVDIFVHTIAPLISLVPALITFAVIPFGGKYMILGHEVNLVIADLDMGLLFLFAFGSLATFGPVLAGWASNNNWSMMGGLRAAAQMLAYEVAMGLAIIGIILVYGSVRLTDIGMAQDGNILNWGIFLQPLGFILYFTCSIAENKRLPFDLPEAESEIVAGYFTEYSGMKFIMFYIAEFLEIATIGAVITATFLGAWHLPFITDAMLVNMFGFLGTELANVAAMVVGVSVFFAKVMFMVWLQVLIRWTLPRFRYDQVMDLGWKMLLPLALLNIVVTGIFVFW